MFLLSSVVGCIYGVSSESRTKVMVMTGNGSIISVLPNLDTKAVNVLDKAIVNAVSSKDETYNYTDVVRGKYKGILYKYPDLQTIKIDGSTVTSDIFALLLKEKETVICVFKNDKLTAVYITKDVEEEIETLIIDGTLYKTE